MGQGVIIDTARDLLDFDKESFSNGDVPIWNSSNGKFEGGLIDLSPLMPKAGGTFTGPVTIDLGAGGSGGGDVGLIFPDSPPLVTTKSLIQFGSSIVGGSSGGTYQGINAPALWAGDFFRAQVAGVNQIVLTGAGRISQGGTPVTNAAHVIGYTTAYNNHYIALQTQSTNGTVYPAFTISASETPYEGYPYVDQVCRIGWNAGAGGSTNAAIHGLSIGMEYDWGGLSEFHISGFEATTGIERRLQSFTWSRAANTVDLYHQVTSWSLWDYPHSAQWVSATRNGNFTTQNLDWYHYNNGGYLSAYIEKEGSAKLRNLALGPDATQDLHDTDPNNPGWIRVKCVTAGQPWLTATNGTHTLAGVFGSVDGMTGHIWGMSTFGSYLIQGPYGQYIAMNGSNSEIRLSSGAGNYTKLGNTGTLGVDLEIIGGGIKTNGHINIASAGLEIGGTQIITSDRNINNLSIPSGAGNNIDGSVISSGLVSAAYGGTGLASPVAGRVLFGSGTSPIGTSSVFTYTSPRLNVNDACIGQWTGATGYAVFCHQAQQASSTGYCLISDNTGGAYFNSTLDLSFRVLNTEFLSMNRSRIYIINTTGAPGVPTGGGYLYVESGALKYRGSSGTITTLGVA